jgi:tetratricopeptide (TPR) repeat protein
MAIQWNRLQFSLSRLKMARLSAAKKRISRRTVYEQRSIWHRIASSWQLVGVIWNAVAKFVLQLAGLSAFALIGVLLWKALTQKTITIAPISVPKMLAESGYTADVAAQRLRDALNKVLGDPHSKGPVVALQTEIPSIVVPTIGLSLETVAADVRTFFHIANRLNISGELTMAQERLWLHLRMNGRDFYTSPNGVDQEHSDDLLAPATEKVFEEAYPIIYAGSLKERDPGKSLEIARRIIAVGPETDQSVAAAHNLVGNILLDQRKTDEAITEYRKAIELDPRNAWPHNNLGFALMSGQGKIEEAIGEYRKAIELDPSLALPRRNLGNALHDQGKTDEAIAEYRKAIELDPRYGDPHNNLGNALRDQGKTDEAIALYRRAIELDPHDAWPHNNLGFTLRDQHKTEEAIAEYRKAIELDPSLALPHKNLAYILREQGKTEEADAEDQKAKELGAKHPD